MNATENNANGVNTMRNFTNREEETAVLAYMVADRAMWIENHGRARPLISTRGTRRTPQIDSDRCPLALARLARKGLVANVQSTKGVRALWEVTALGLVEAVARGAEHAEASERVAAKWAARAAELRTREAASVAELLVEVSAFRAARGADVGADWAARFAELAAKHGSNYLRRAFAAKVAKADAERKAAEAVADAANTCEGCDGALCVHMDYGFADERDAAGYPLRACRTCELRGFSRADLDRPACSCSSSPAACAPQLEGDAPQLEGDAPASPSEFVAELRAERAELAASAEAYEQADSARLCATARELVAHPQLAGVQWQPGTRSTGRGPSWEPGTPPVYWLEATGGWAAKTWAGPYGVEHAYYTFGADFAPLGGRATLRAALELLAPAVAA